MFQSHKKIPTVLFLFLFSVAMVVDIVGVLIPGVGSLFVLCCRILFFAFGYDAPNVNTKTFAAFLLGITFIPGSMFFIWMFHRANKKHVQKFEAKQAKKAAKIKRRQQEEEQMMIAQQNMQNMA